METRSAQMRRGHSHVHAFRIPEPSPHRTGELASARSRLQRRPSSLRMTLSAGVWLLRGETSLEATPET